jgi:hypothetical protein
VNKIILFGLSLIFLFIIPLEAQRYNCCGCRRYMDPALAGYEGLYYGYVDNLNYPTTYSVPLNYHFNYCPPCNVNRYNYRYLQNCIHYTNGNNHH